VYNGLGVTPRVVHIDSLKGVVDLVSRDMVGESVRKRWSVRFGLGGDFIDF
jgi:hypothetical protein